MSSYVNMIQSVTLRYNDTIKKQAAHFCEYFNLTHFWYNQISDSGFLTTVCSHVDWSEYIADEKFYLDYPVFRHSQCVHPGVRVLNDFDGKFHTPFAHLLEHGKRKYNMNVWITLLYKVSGGFEEIGLSAKINSVNLILNEIGLVRLFVGKFRKDNFSLFSKLEENKANLIELLGPTFYEKTSPLSSKTAEKRAFLQKLGIDCGNALTQREIEVIRFLLQGYSAGKIAPQLFLSKRTVEHHAERIKEKLGCGSKTELIQKARELDLLGFL